MRYQDIYDFEIFREPMTLDNVVDEEEVLYVKNEIIEGQFRDVKVEVKVEVCDDERLKNLVVKEEVPYIRDEIAEVQYINAINVKICELTREIQPQKFKVQVSDSKRFKCQYCEKDYSATGGLAAHVKAIHHQWKIKCQLCPLNFKWNASFLRHLKKFHGKSEVAKFKCATCEKSFTKRHLMSRHINLEHKYIKFDCPLCSKVYKFKGSWRKHVSGCEIKM
jgi:uncharacterized C2H2 Zn-finger protein